MKNLLQRVEVLENIAQDLELKVETLAGKIESSGIEGKPTRWPIRHGDRVVYFNLRGCAVQLGRALIDRNNPTIFRIEGKDLQYSVFGRFVGPETSGRVVDAMKILPNDRIEESAGERLIFMEEEWRKYNKQNEEKAQ